MNKTGHILQAGGHRAAFYAAAAAKITEGEENKEERLQIAGRDSRRAEKLAHGTSNVVQEVHRKTERPYAALETSNI